jgi:hypothetical protein
MCIVFSEFPSTEESLPEKDEKFTAEQNFNLLVCSSQKNHKMFFFFGFPFVHFVS